MRNRIAWLDATCAAALLLCSAVRADSIDDAEAKRRGIPVAQVQLENAQARNAELERQIAALQAQLKSLQTAQGTASAGNTAAARNDASRGAPAADAHAPKKGKELSLDLGNNQTLKLVEILPGKFLMGSPKDEPNHFRDEEQHEVTLTKAYYIGVTVVTVDQFATFVKDTDFKTTADTEGITADVDVTDGHYAASKVKGRTWRNPAFEQKGDYPVQDVSFLDAQAFCDWLAKKSGKKVSLPTEAQWEFAARAGKQTIFPWGDNRDDAKGWGNFADKIIDEKMFRNGTTFYYGEFFDFDDGYFHTSPVTAFKPNGFGLYDVLGNVEQWCLDGWWDYDTKPAIDPMIEDRDNHRILRGSSWITELRKTRLACREWMPKEGHDSTTGFRVVVNE